MLKKKGKGTMSQEQKRKNIEKIKAQFYRCRATKEEQIDAVLELLGELLQQEKHYKQIHNKLAQIGILSLKIKPTIAKEWKSNKFLLFLLSNIKNFIILFQKQKRQHMGLAEKDLKLFKIMNHWEQITILTQKYMEESESMT